MRKNLKIAGFCSLAAVIVIMVAATFVEKIHGSSVSLKYFYHNPVFMVLWGVAAVCGLWYFLSEGNWRKKPATLLLHVSFIVILVGALITHLWGMEGQVRLDPGVCVSQWEMEDGTHMDLPVPMTLQKFEIEKYPGSDMPMDYRSTITLGTGAEAYPLVISMNKIGKIQGYRFYQADYDGDSSILMVAQDPWGVGITYAGYVLLLIGMIGFLLNKESGRHFPLAVKVGVPLALVILLIIFGTGPFSSDAMLLPVLRSRLLLIHVTPIVLSYILFLTVFIIGIIGLINKKSSAHLMELSVTILYPAVFLLAFGTFLGAVWANISWGSYWAWDPKETWALITLLVYMIPLHGKALKAFRNPRFFHTYVILAILCVLITYFGVNLILGGMHSYS